MSTPETAIPAAPAAEPVAPAAPVTPTTPARALPLRVDEIKTQAKEALEALRSARATASPPAETVAPTPTVTPTVDATGRAHAPDGKYLPAETAGTTVAPAKPEPVSAPGIRIPVPENHWLREQGVTEMVAPDENEARRLRGLLKDASRRSEVSTLREQLIDAQAQLRASTEARQSIVTDPELLGRIQELRALGHTDMADLIVQGLEKKQADKVGEYSKEERAKFTEQDNTVAVSEFRDTTLEVAKGRYPAFWVNSTSFLPACRQALFQYANDVSFREQSGEKVKLSPEGVWDYLDRLYLRDPDAQNHVRNRPRAQALALPSDAAARHATNSPLSAIPSAVRTNHLSTTPASIDRTKLSADQLKRELKRELFNRPA